MIFQIPYNGKLNHIQDGLLSEEVVQKWSFFSIEQPNGKFMFCGAENKL
jgi:hypothetical protein